MDHRPVLIYEEKMRLDPVTQLSLERVRTGIVDVEINEVDVFLPLCFEPVHDGRQSLAGRSPESKELDQSHPAGAQLHAARIRRR
jgi:hypothetical protein